MRSMIDPVVAPLSARERFVLPYYCSPLACSLAPENCLRYFLDPYGDNIFL